MAMSDFDGTSDTQAAREMMAARVAEAAASYGREHSGKVWIRDGKVRVYLTRGIGRKAQPMGFIEILDDGTRDYGGVDRNKAGVRDHVEAEVAS